MKKSILFASLLAFCATPAFAQSFGQQMVEEDQQYNAAQGVYAPPLNVEPVQQPTVYMGGGNYMTPQGPVRVIDNSEPYGMATGAAEAPLSPY